MVLSIERKIAKNSSIFGCVIVAFCLSQCLIIGTFHHLSARHDHDGVAAGLISLTGPAHRQVSSSSNQPQRQQQQQAHRHWQPPLRTQMTTTTRQGQPRRAPPPQKPQSTTATTNVAALPALQAARDYANSFVALGKGPLNFVHIPKTAGTSVEQAAARRGIPWGSCRFFHKPKRDACPYPAGPDWPRYVGWWHLPAYIFPLMLTTATKGASSSASSYDRSAAAATNPYQSTDLFAIVRDPYDRMVSEFYYICTLKVKEWRPDQCDNRTRLFESEYMNAWLVKKLQQQQQPQRQQGRSARNATGWLADNSHFTPQYDFLVGPHETRVVDHVLRMDDPRLPLADQFARLVAAFGMPAAADDDDDDNNNSRNNSMKLDYMGAISAGERNTTRHLTTKHLQPSTLDWIHRRYPHDFDALGYARMGESSSSSSTSPR